MANKTQIDANIRIGNARYGHLVNASDEFLEQLQHQLEVWLRDIHLELSRRYERIVEQEVIK